METLSQDIFQIPRRMYALVSIAKKEAACFNCYASEFGAWFHSAPSEGQ
jgi:hypothetical protein